MILTCPTCASRYFVDDAKMGPAGKQVRCTACGTKWLATAEAAPALTPAPELAAAPTAAEPAAAAAATAPVVEKSVARQFRHRVQTERKDKEAKTVGAIWAGMAAFLVVLGALAVLFRADVVDVWPKTARAYAGIGLPVNRIGLQIEDVTAAPTLADGHAGLTVTGALRNITGRTVISPNIEIKLTNPAGKVVAGKLVAPADPQIPAGQARHFTVTLLDPPSTAQDLLVAFALDGGGKAEKLKAPTLADGAAPDLRPAAAPDAVGGDAAPGPPAAVQPVGQAQ